MPVAQGGGGAGASASGAVTGGSGPGSEVRRGRVARWGRPVSVPVEAVYVKLIDPQGRQLLPSPFHFAPLLSSQSHM